MADNNDSSGTEWYEEPVTIVGFVAGFLLLVLVIASILILCHSSEEDEEDEEDAAPQRNGGLEDVKTEERWTEFEHDRTNPLYINANEFPLQTTSLRASYVHIHVDGGTPNDGFQAYYNR